MKNKHLIVATIILSVISLFIGAKTLSIQDLINGGETEVLVFMLSRIPRLISILITGMALSISGLIMQQITRNKFVSPSTAATMDSAKFGILVSMIFLPGLPVIGKMGIAFIFALGGTFLFMFILRKIKGKNVIVIPLVGIMLGNLIDSITTFVSYRFDLIQNINAWLQGSFSMVTKGRYEIIYLAIPLGIIAYIFANKFTIAGMGEDFAKNRGDNLKNSLGTTALLGAVFLLFCDILGRVLIYPYEISISLTVGVLGSIVFLYLIFKGVKK